MEKLLVLGAGGFGHVVAEIAADLGYEVSFLDDAARGRDVIGRCMDYEALLGRFDKAVAAFGNNRLVSCCSARWSTPTASWAMPV